MRNVYFRGAKCHNSNMPKQKNASQKDKIHAWISKFKKNWEGKDIDGVMELFADNVEYWETPFRKFKDKHELRSEWQNIKKQQNISVDCIVFSQEGDKYTVTWDLKSTDEDGTKKHCAGVYLVKLNSSGDCEYFLQCCEVSS